MADLTLSPIGPLDAANLPFETGDIRLSAAPLCEMYSIAPLKGKTLKLPPVGKVSYNGDVKTLWFGQGQWLVIGAAMTETPSAVVTDQSDAWACLELRGPLASDVMSRLCPLDVATMEIGQTARTELAHMMASVTPVEGGFDILLMCSFAVWGAEHIVEAMRSVAGQATLV